MSYQEITILKNKWEEETVQILKYDFITCQGQDLFPLLSIIIKVDGIRFGIIFAFQTTFQKYLHCSAKGKSFAYLFTALNNHSFTQSTILLYSYYVPGPGLNTRQTLVSKAGGPCPRAFRVWW